MSYDRRIKTANRLSKQAKSAESKAKARWGSGWQLLSEEQKAGAVCLEFVGILGTMDLGSIYEDKLGKPGTEDSMFQLLSDISNIAPTLIV